MFVRQLESARIGHSKVRKQPGRSAGRPRKSAGVGSECGIMLGSMNRDLGPETRPSLIRDFANPNNVDSRRKFIEIYEPLLFRYVRAKGLSEAATRDVVQDVWVRLLQYLPKFRYDPKLRFRSWLWRVTMSAYGEWGKGENKLPAGRDIDAVAGAEPVDPEFDREFRRHVLQVVLAQIKPTIQDKTWSCFEEHLLKGRPTKEVAAELDIKANTVVVNAARVLTKVRALCLEYAEEELSDLALPGEARP
jgi:RNA polymerase sigma-70 factor (ECF subfamily)